MSILIDIITYAAPVGFACYGGLLSEKVGIVQISLEGMMLIGALAAVICKGELNGTRERENYGEEGETVRKTSN